MHLVPIVSTSYGLTYSLPNSSVKQMAIILVLQTMKLERKKAEKVSQGHTAWKWQSWDFYPGKLFQGFALYNSLWSHLLCQTTDHTGFWGVVQFESAKEKIWGQFWVSLTSLSRAAGIPEKLQGPEWLLWGQEWKINKLTSHFQGVYSWGDVILQIISM